MVRRRLLQVLLGTAVGGLAGPAAAGGETARKLHRVEIRRFAFHPRALEIRPGDSVVWINLDLAPHTASPDPGTSGHGTWDSGTLAKNATYQTRFDSPGSVTYHCAFHPRMLGWITIAAA